MARSAESNADNADVDRFLEKISDVEGALTGIRETLDAIRKDLDWWVKNSRREEWTPIEPMASTPKDPLTPDWAERVNKCTAADCLHGLARPPPTPPASSAAPRVAADAIDDETRFCCEAADLQWTGDARLPGVACQNCGYIVADCGSVVMEPASDDDRKSASESRAERQRDLFEAD